MNVSLINFLNTDEDLQLKTLEWRNSKQVTKYFQIQNITLDTHKKWLQSLKQTPPKTIAFFIQADGINAGVTYFHSIDYGKKECNWGMYIYDENHRGKGIGRQTLLRCIDYAKNNIRCDKIKLEVLKDNPNAIKLYESLGFKKYEEKDNVLKYEMELKTCTPRISVLMPVYKPQPHHFKEAIDSILSQTFSDLELIMVDDCPEDKLAQDVVNSYTDERIKYFRNEKNLGIAETRNRLLEIALKSPSEFIAIVDHDDIQLPTKYEKMVNFLDKNPEIGVVGAGFYEWWENTGKIKENFLPEFDFLIRFYTFIGRSGIIHASMVRKELFQKYNIRYLNKYSENSDQMMWMDMLKHTQFYNIPELLMKYRWHDTNTSVLLKHREKEFMHSILDYTQEKYAKESKAAKAILEELSPKPNKSKYKRLFHISLFISIVLIIALIVMLLLYLS